MPLDPARLLRARHRIRDYLDEQNADPQAIDEVVLAIEEAMTNAVRHSGAIQDLEVALWLEDADLVTVVSDRGRGFDVDSFDPSISPSLDEPSGRGLFLISRLMDDMALRLNDGLELRAVKRHAVRRGAERQRTAQMAPGAQLQRDLSQRKMLDELPEMYAALDWEFRYLYVNRSFCEVTGRTSEALLGRTLWAVFPEVLGTDVEAHLLEAMNLGVPSFYEFFFSPLDSWFEQRLYPTPFGISQFSVPINERKRRERERDELFDALRESEARFAAMFEKSPFALALSELPERTLLAVNAAFERLFGFAREDLIGRTSIDLGIADRSSNEEVARRLASEGEVHDFECRRTTKSGEQRWISLNVDHITIQGKDHVLSTVDDITERKHAEEALRESEERYRRIVETSTEGIVIADPAGLITYANQRFAEMLGYEVEELVGAYSQDMIDPDFRSGVREARSRLQTGEVVREEVKFRHKDGGTVWTLFGATPVRDGAGTHLGNLAMHVDITERKRLEEELAREREQAQHLVRHAATGIYEIDFRGPRFVSVNDFMCTYSGYSREELLATNPMDLLDEDSQTRFRDRIAKALSGEPVDPQVEYCFMTKQGEKRWAVLNVTPTFEDGQPVGAFVVGQDVTDRKRAEDERARLVAALHEERDKLSALINGITDEIWFAEPDGKVTLVNPAVWEHFGAVRPEQVEEIASRFEVYRADGSPRPPHEAPPLRALRGETVSDEEEIVRTPATGELRHRIVNGAPVRDDDGAIIGSVCVVRDITERRRAEEALRLSEERVRSLYEEQRQIATTLQESLLYPVPDVEGLDLASRSLPANQPELVGGDFSDVSVLADGQVLLVIGDVAGKGIPAAGLTETVRSTMRAFAAIDSSPAFILRKTNELLMRDDREQPHVTALVCLIDPRTGHVAVASAGHPAPVHLSLFSCDILDLPFGPPLGTFPADYVPTYLTLSLDDCLALYTDGVTEARRNGEMLGEKRLVEALSALRGRSANEVAEVMVRLAEDFSDKLSDDVQVTVLRLA